MRLRFAIAASVLAVGSLQGQPASDSSRAAALRRLEIGTPIRIRTVGQSVYAGRLVARTDTGIVIREARTLQSASISRIGAVWLRHNSVGRGALYGGTAGLIASGLFFGWVGQGLCDSNDCTHAFRDGVLWGAPSGAIVGAAAGAAIGVFVHHWRPYWP